MYSVTVLLVIIGFSTILNNIFSVPVGCLNVN